MAFKSCSLAGSCQPGALDGVSEIKHLVGIQVREGERDTFGIDDEGFDALFVADALRRFHQLGRSLSLATDAVSDVERSHQRAGNSQHQCCQRNRVDDAAGDLRQFLWR